MEINVFMYVCREISVTYFIICQTCDNDLSFQLLTL